MPAPSNTANKSKPKKKFKLLFLLLAAAVVIAVIIGVIGIIGFFIFKPATEPESELPYIHEVVDQTSELILFNVDTSFTENLKEYDLDLDTNISLAGDTRKLEEHLRLSKTDTKILVDGLNKEIRTYRKGQIPPATIKPLPDSTADTISILQDLMQRHGKMDSSLSERNHLNP